MGAAGNLNRAEALKHFKNIAGSCRTRNYRLLRMLVEGQVPPRSAVGNSVLGKVWWAPRGEDNTIVFGIPPPFTL